MSLLTGEANFELTTLIGLRRLKMHQMYPVFERVFQAQIAFFADQFQKRLKALKQPNLRGWLRGSRCGTHHRCLFRNSPQRNR